MIIFKTRTLHPLENSLTTHRTGRCVSSRFGQDAFNKRKISCPDGNLTKIPGSYSLYPFSHSSLDICGWRKALSLSLSLPRGFPTDILHHLHIAHLNFPVVTVTNVTRWTAMQPVSYEKLNRIWSIVTKRRFVLGYDEQQQRRCGWVSSSRFSVNVPS